MKGKWKCTLRMVVLLTLSSMLNIGTIRKKEDPILKAQTDPISYKQKMDDMKDGVPKGAPMPSFNVYPQEKFMFQGGGVDRAAPEQAEEAPQASPEQITEVQPDQQDTSEEWWTEDGESETKPAASAKS